MADTQFKVGDVVLSIYPPDYPDDDTYYNAKIVEVGEGVRASLSSHTALLLLISPNDPITNRKDKTRRSKCYSLMMIIMVHVKTVQIVF